MNMCTEVAGEQAIRSRAGPSTSHAAFVAARAAGHCWLAVTRMWPASAFHAWSDLNGALSLVTIGVRRGSLLRKGNALRHWRKRARAAVLAYRLAQKCVMLHLAAALAAAARATAASLAAAARATRAHTHLLRRSLMSLAMALIARTNRRRALAIGRSSGYSAALRRALREWAVLVVLQRRVKLRLAARTHIELRATLLSWHLLSRKQRAHARLRAVRVRHGLRRWRRAWRLARRKDIAQALYLPLAHARKRKALCARALAAALGAATSAGTAAAVDKENGSHLQGGEQDCGQPLCLCEDSAPAFSVRSACAAMDAASARSCEPSPGASPHARELTLPVWMPRQPAAAVRGCALPSAQAPSLGAQLTATPARPPWLRAAAAEAAHYSLLAASAQAHGCFETAWDGRVCDPEPESCWSLERRLRALQL